VGSVEKSKAVTGKNIQAGDVLVALPSSGVHSNGFSLVRKVLERAELTVHDTAPWDASTTAGQSLLTPTVLYVNDVLAVHNSCGFKGAVHITGGGFYENIPRVLPKTMGCKVDSNAWTPLPVFQWLQETGTLFLLHFLCPKSSTVLFFGFFCMLLAVNSCASACSMCGAMPTLYERSVHISR
jgi:phosphoribosylaminoimidazole synthetase